MQTQTQAPEPQTNNPGRSIPDVPLAKHINHTPFPSQYFQSVDKHGVVSHVVVLRVTYDMLQTMADGSLTYAAEQTPLATKDAWTGEVNTSSPLWESDFAPYKPKCDVLVVNAVSRPPNHKPAQRWPCGVSLTWQQDGRPQSWQKTLAITGPRQFGLLGLSQPQASTEVAIDWQLAYGGQMPETKAGRDDERIDERNPVGVGLNKARGQAAPQLEVMNKPYTDGLGQSDYPPVCLSAVSKAWLPRSQLAGTYDDTWLKTQWPLPPLDFDDAYWNCAPPDQQVPHLPAGVTVVLADLYPSRQSEGLKPWPADWRVKLPMQQLFVLAYYSDIPGRGTQTAMKLDTLVIDLKTQQIYATYRHVQKAFQDDAALVVETRMTEASPSAPTNTHINTQINTPTNSLINSPTNSPIKDNHHGR